VIGGMRHRVVIQEAATTADSFGAPSLAWTDAAERWAEVRPLAGRELWEARSVRPDVTHAVTLRYYEGLTPRHRLVHEGRVLRVESVLNPDGRKRFHELLCKEEV
jgi:SPP1 family predicted phage head-tail adaptor